MKKLACFMIAFAFVFLLAACGRSPEADADKKDSGENAANAGVTAVFEAGNYYLEEKDRSPVSVWIDLPEGWTIKKGVPEGTAYYPDDELMRNSIIGRYGCLDRSYAVYDGNGEPVGVLIYSSMIWTDEMKSEFGYDGLDKNARLDLETDIAFSEFRGSLSQLSIRGADVRTVSSSEGCRVMICSTDVTSTVDSDGNKTRFSCPAIAAYSSELGIGVVAEFAPSALSDTELEAIARSIVISAGAK